MRLINVRRRLDLQWSATIPLAWRHIPGDYMSGHALPVDRQPDGAAQPARQRESSVCEDSGLRRKFLEFCDDNPSAPECLVYDL